MLQSHVTARSSVSVTPQIAFWRLCYFLYTCTLLCNAVWMFLLLYAVRFTCFMPNSSSYLPHPSQYDAIAQSSSSSSRKSNESKWQKCERKQQCCRRPSARISGMKCIKYSIYTENIRIVKVVHYSIGMHFALPFYCVVQWNVGTRQRGSDENSFSLVDRSEGDKKRERKRERKKYREREWPNSNRVALDSDILLFV